MTATGVSQDGEKEKREQRREANLLGLLLDLILLQSKMVDVQLAVSQEHDIELV